MKNWSSAVQLLVLGFYVALSLLIPTGAGLWLGYRMGHEVAFPLTGLGIGTAVMIYGVYRMVKPFLLEARKKGQEEQLWRPTKTLAGMVSPKQGKDRESG